MHRDGRALWGIEEADRWELGDTLICLDETSTLVLLMKMNYVSTLRTTLLLIYFSDFVLFM